MKRRLLSILLALVLTLALLPTAALADGETGTVTWTEIGPDNTGKLQTSGYYKLKENIYNLNGLDIGPTSAGATITLDLNGHTLTGTNESLYTLWINQNTTLTLKDSAGGGKVVSENGTAIFVSLGSTFTMDAGEIRGKSAGIELNSQNNLTTFTMNGGSVTGGIVVGGSNSKMELNDGTVDGIWLGSNSTLYANGGTVTGPSLLEGNVVGISTDFQVAGQGTSKEPWELKTADQLKAFRDLVNKGYIGACAELTDDIVLDSNEAWTPIGNYTIENQIFYEGTFDGNGHTISGLNVTGDYDYAGLFGVVTGGTIKNLAVAGNVSPSSSLFSEAAAGIVGQASYSTTIENCSNHCRVTSGGGASVGGIAGYNVDGATITDCYNVGTITGARTSAGGIAGNNSGTISNCYNVGTVSNGANVGEIIGNNMRKTVKNCYYLNTANNTDVGTGYSTNTSSMTAAQFADGTVRDLLYAGRNYDAQPWDSTCRLVTDVNMTLPVFKWQAPEEPAPSESSSGSRFSYSTISASAGENGKISPSGDLSVRDGNSQTFVFTPDKGYRVKDVLVGGKSVGALRSYTFATVRKDQTIEVIFEKIPAFTDVPAGSYYEEAVNWALENWITEGTSDTLFSPDAPCTRAQAVTFLWRAAGCPAPSSYSMPFEDVKSDSYYYQAVLWAIENGIAQGTSETTFEPDAICTRAQIVCFLFRFKAANGMDAVTLAELLGGFADSAEIPAYARPALNWALSANVLQGSGAKLLPNDACTRAQIVTFLYRSMR